MLNNTRLNVYKYAYTVRIKNHEKIEDIDKEYMEKAKLTKEDIEQIHHALGLE